MVKDCSLPDVKQNLKSAQIQKLSKNFNWNVKETFFNLYINHVAAFDRTRLSRLKKIPTLYFVNIETVNICQTNKEKETLSLKNLFRLSREGGVSITCKIYAVIWQRLLLPLLQNVSSLSEEMFMFGCTLYF